jgi:hypothetical protein
MVQRAQGPALGTARIIQDRDLDHREVTMKGTKALILIFAFSIAANAQVPNFTPPTPLIAAAVRNDTTEVKRILHDGADPNEGRLAGFSPIFFAIYQHNMEMFRTMIASGADVRATDPAGSTTLMWAAADELARADFVEEILKLGGDVNAKNKSGDTALSWALRRGSTPVVAVLRRAGAREDGRIKVPVEKAVALLQKSGTEFTKVSGCVSCHNQSIPQMAVSAARAQGFAVNASSATEQANGVHKFYGSLVEMMRNEPEHIPDPAVSVSYALLGLAAEGQPPDAVTASMASVIAKHQLADGRFRTLAVRPPIESSEFTPTALSIRALALYGEAPQRQIVAARQWLETARPQSNEDIVMQLLGLAWAEADPAYLRKVADVLVAQQGSDGGWAQLPHLSSDAYATGQALVALATSGQVTTSDPVYQRGIDYLLRTQMADGSWLVRTRAFPFQIYRDAGFPHGKDQFISAAGTSWAVMALSQCPPE